MLIFLTNNFHLKATGIVQLYKHRWEIEMFIKVDQVKSENKILLVTHRNAVQTQVWIAVSVYGLVPIARGNLCSQSLYEILQIFKYLYFLENAYKLIFQKTQLQYFKE